MIIQCQSCAAKYLLPDSKLPPKSIRVQCPKCKAIFRLSPQAEKVVSAAQASASVPVQEAPLAPQEPLGAAVIPTPEPDSKAQAPGGGSKEDRARRLARVLVSDILCYNKDKRDQALIDGNLITVLGEEIKKSWELYKEKVGADVASSTNYFKEALNEILADGQKVF